MSDQVVHWMEMAGAAAEGLLVIRILSLKLHRIYAFVTLFCGLNFFFDAVWWWLGSKSQESERLYTYSLFLLAAFSPFAAWDVFEEVKRQASKLMRLQALRLVSGLLVTTICGTIFTVIFDLKDAQGNSMTSVFLAVFLWTGSASACFTFLWFTYRMIRAQKIEPPHNTFVWTTFLLLYLVLGIVGVMLNLFGISINTTGSVVLPMVLNSLQLVVIGWCIARLKATSSQAPSAPERPA